MKSEILSEIRRVKEIMGITPQLVNEQFAAYLKSIAKSGKAELKAELKNYLKTYADAMGVPVDEALEAFEKDYSEALLTGYPDIQIQKVFDDYFGVVSKEYADDLVGIYARTAPLEFGREVVGVEMGKGSMPVYDKFMKPETKLTEKSIEQAEDYLRYVESVRDNISPLTQTDRYAIESLDEFAQTLDNKIKEFKNSASKVATTVDDIYDSLVAQGRNQKPPLKFPGKEELMKYESQLKKEFKTPEEAIAYWMKKYGSDKTVADSVDNALKIATNTSGGVVNFVKTWGWKGALVIIGVIVGYNYMVTSESDAEDQQQLLADSCPKLAGKMAIREEWEELFNQYKVIVIYDNKVVDVVKEDNWKLVINGVKIPLDCADEKLGVGDVSLLTGGGEGGGGNSKEYTQTLDDFKKFLVDNSLGTDDATNDTEESGYWKANGKDYSYDTTTKTFKED
jgi:hypothetical protein